MSELEERAIRERRELSENHKMLMDLLESIARSNSTPNWQKAAKTILEKIMEGTFNA